MSAIAVHGISKRFGAVEVLRGLDLDVAAGELVAVLGPSGCGKTTLLRALAGFERIDDGTIVVGDQVMAGPGVHRAPHRRGMAVVPQEGALFPHLDVAANVGFGLPRGERRGPRVSQLLEVAGLTLLAKRLPHELSGGQQQRVAVARALAPSPAVVLLDEPFSGLDAALRASIRGEVLELLRMAGTTAVLVTHDQEEALSLADHVAIMRAGSIVQQGTPADVYNAPVDLQVAAFLGDANVLPGIVRNGSVSCGLGTLPTAADTPPGPVRVLIRPEQIALGGSLPAEVLERRYYGHDTVLRVKLTSAETLLVRTTRHTGAPVGSHVGLAVDGPVTCYPDAP